MFLEIECPKCFSILKGTEINIHEVNANCQHCSNSFSFQDQLPLELRRKFTIFSPKGITKLRTSDTLTFDIVWRDTIFKKNIHKKFTIGDGCFGAIKHFLAFLFLLLLSAFENPLINVGLFSVVLSIWFYHTVYKHICKYVNKTILEIKNEEIWVKPRYLPTFTRYSRVKTIQVKDVQQFFVKQLQVTLNSFNGTNDISTNNFSWVSTNDSPPPQKWLKRYALCVQLKDGETVELISEFQIPQTALYLEQEIEKFLGIVDEKMEGEWKA